MKECPKCKTQVLDTAKFCVKCGFNIKKYEEDNAKHFCPECGTEFTGGYFCPECGYNIKEELNLNDSNISSSKKTSKNIDLSTIDFESDEEVIVPKKKKTKIESIDLDDFGLDAPKKKRTKIESIDLDDFGLDTSKTKKNTTSKTKPLTKVNENLLSLFEYEERKTGGYVIKKYIDSIETRVIVPEGVVAINDGAFEKSLVISVQLPEGVKVIGKRAFADAKYLKKLNIPSTVNRIDDEAFINCVKLDINIPDTVSIRGKDLLVNTLAEVNAKKRLEQERLAKIRAEEEKKLKILNDHKLKCIDEVNNYAKDKNCLLNLPIDKINDADNAATATRAKNSIIKLIDADCQRKIDEENLIKAKPKAIKELTALAKKKGVCYEPSYTKDIKATASIAELEKVINTITKKMDDILASRNKNKSDKKLEDAKIKAKNEINLYFRYLGISGVNSYNKTIDQATSLEDLAKKVAKIKSVNKK